VNSKRINQIWANFKNFIQIWISYVTATLKFAYNSNVWMHFNNLNQSCVIEIAPLKFGYSLDKIEEVRSGLGIL